MMRPQPFLLRQIYYGTQSEKTITLQANRIKLACLLLDRWFYCAPPLSPPSSIFIIIPLPFFTKTTPATTTTTTTTTTLLPPLLLLIGIGWGLRDGHRNCASLPGREKIYLSSKASRAALRPTQPLLQWLLQVPSLEVKQSGCEVNHLPQSIM